MTFLKKFVFNLKKLNLFLLSILTVIKMVEIKKIKAYEPKLDLLKFKLYFFENWLLYLGYLLIFISISGVMFTIASFKKRK